MMSEGAIGDVFVLALLIVVVFFCACIVGFGFALLASIFVHVVSLGWHLGGWLASA